MKSMKVMFSAQCDKYGRITNIRRKPSPGRNWVAIVVAAVVVAVIVAIAAVAQAAVIPDYRDFGDATDIECEDGWVAFRRAAADEGDWEVVGIMEAMDAADVGQQN